MRSPMPAAAAATASQPRSSRVPTRTRVSSETVRRRAWSCESAPVTMRCSKLAKYALVKSASRVMTCSWYGPGLVGSSWPTSARTRGATARFARASARSPSAAGSSPARAGRARARARPAAAAAAARLPAASSTPRRRRRRAPRPRCGLHRLGACGGRVVSEVLVGRERLVGRADHCAKSCDVPLALSTATCVQRAHCANRSSVRVGDRPAALAVARAAVAIAAAAAGAIVAAARPRRRGRPHRATATGGATPCLAEMRAAAPCPPRASRSLTSAAISRAASPASTRARRAAPAAGGSRASASSPGSASASLPSQWSRTARAARRPHPRRRARSRGRGRRSRRAP